MARPDWLVEKVVLSDALPITLPKRKVPVIYMAGRVWLTCLLLAFSAMGAVASMHDHGIGDPILGFILFTLALLYFYASSPDAGSLVLDHSGFTYRQLFSVSQVEWSKVSRVASGRVPTDILGLVLVTIKGQKRPLSISGYFDVSGEDLAAAMSTLSKPQSSERL